MISNNPDESFVSSPYKALFETARMGNLTAKNRIAMPAIHLGMARDGSPTPQLMDFYEKRANGGSAMITVGVCDTFVKSNGNLHGVLSLASDFHIDGMESLAARIKKGGALAGVQLSPLAGYNDPNLILNSETLFELLTSIGHAAKRAWRAGFDFVELMLSGGSILSHFLSPVHNKWNIEGYSGEWTNRLRAPIEAVKIIKGEVGDFPLFARIHCHEFLDGGYGVDGSVVIAKALVDAGVEVINITGAGHRTKVPQLTSHALPGSLAHLARRIRESVMVPTLFGGRITTPAEAVDVLERSSATSVNLCRALVVDPDWLVKVRENRVENIVPCMSCVRCFDRVFSKIPMRCSLNPEVGVANCGSKVGSSGSAVIIGGGPAGMQAAITLRQGGNRVVLYEKEDRLGGRWLKIGALGGCTDTIRAARAFVKKISEMGIDERLGRSPTPDEIKEMNPDLLIIATGAKPRIPDIPGMDSHPMVLHADQIIEDDSLVGNSVAIIGGGGAAVELAIHLSRQVRPSPETIGHLAYHGSLEWADEAMHFEPARTVTLMKRKGFIGKGLGRSVRWTMINDLEKLDVKVLDRVVYEKITDSGVHIYNGRSGEHELVKADTIILATGYEPDTDFVSSFEGCAKKVIPVGDTQKVANIGEAIRDAFDKTSQI